MILTRPQVEELLNIIEFHFLHTITVNFGADTLSDSERSILSNFGLDLEPFLTDATPYNKMYILGKLTALIGDANAKGIEYSDFLKYIKYGQYVPLTRRERAELDIAKRKTYTHLKGLKEKAKDSFEMTLLDHEKITREKYEATVKKEITEGVLNKKSAQSIVSSLGNNLDVWGHDWGRIVDTEMNNIFQQGRAEMIKEDHPDALVYKDVYKGACRHCIEKYLTNGIGSKPRIFKLSELEANGTNVGKKVADWKATVGGLHPFCRCTLSRLPEGFEWNEEKEKFELPDDFKRKIERKSKITITVGDKVIKV